MWYGCALQHTRVVAAISVCPAADAVKICPEQVFKAGRVLLHPVHNHVPRTGDVLYSRTAGVLHNVLEQEAGLAVSARELLAQRTA